MEGGADHVFDDLPATLADFPRRWNSEALPRLRAMEKDRVRAVRILFGGIATGVVLFGGYALWRSTGTFGGFEVFAVFFLFICSIIASWWPLGRLMPKVKATMIEAITAATGLVHQADGFDPDRLADFQNHNLLPGYNKSDFEDRLSGRHGVSDFILYEALLQQESGSGKNRTVVTVFHGLLMILDFPSSALSRTVLARDAGIFDSLVAPKGMKRAGLEDPKFEKIFTAWTTDQVEARYFLNPVVMESLLSLETRFKGKKLRCAFLPGELLLAIETGNWFEAGSPFKTLDDPARGRQLAGEIATVFSLIESLAACAPHHDRQRRDESAG